MKRDTAYDVFIDTLLAEQMVYTLQTFDGEFEEVAECGSAVYSDEYDEPVPVYCFWHTEAAALACRKDEWADFELIRADLGSFIRDALINMDQDAVLVGVNFDAELVGVEIEPMELLAELLDTAAERGIELDIPDYDDVLHYRTEWEKLMAGHTKLH